MDIPYIQLLQMQEMEDYGELDGIWVAKFEAVSNTPTASNGGGNATNLKVQVIPNVTKLEIHIKQIQYLQYVEK